MKTAVSAPRPLRRPLYPLLYPLVVALLAGCDYIQFSDETDVDVEQVCADRDPSAYFCADITATQQIPCNSGPDGSTDYLIRGQVVEPEPADENRDRRMTDLDIGLLLYGGPYQADNAIAWQNLPSPYHWASDRQELELYANNPSAPFTLIWVDTPGDETRFTLRRQSVNTEQFGLRAGIDTWSLYGEVILADEDDVLLPTGKAYPLECDFEGD